MIELVEYEEIIEEDISEEVVEQPVQQKNTKFPEAVLEDKQGRELWVRTRLCYCDKDAPTDCRFHSISEKGWETCPNTEHAQKSRLKGRWLWAHNPEFGKPPEESEISHVEIAL